MQNSPEEMISIFDKDLDPTFLLNFFFCMFICRITASGYAAGPISDGFIKSHKSKFIELQKSWKSVKQ